MNKLISHHLGMGDMIVHNGLVRYIYKRDYRKYKTIYLLCYKHNAANVRRMYDDLKKFALLEIENEYQIGNAIDSFIGDKEDFHLNQEGYTLYDQIGDDAFFLNKNYNKSLRKQFKISRDSNIENEVYNNLINGVGEYIFIHDDAERGYKIPDDKLPPLPRVRIPKSVALFDTLKIIENAKECHVISSAFVCLLQSMPSLNKNVTVHTSVRNPHLKNYFESDGLKTI